MGKLLLFFKELRDFKRFRKIDKKDRDIVFYSEGSSYYGYFEGIIDYLTNKLNLKVHYVTSEADDPIFETENRNIIPFYINNLVGFFTRLLDSKLLIMTMTDLGNFHIKRSEYGAKHIYVFHHIGSTHLVLRHGALDNYDVILCAGPHQMEEIRRAEELYRLKKKMLVKYGYYRLEKIFKESGLHEKKPSGYKAKILVAPSWGEKNIFELCGRELIRELTEGGYEVIARPHPMQWHTNAKLLEALEKEFQGMGNFILERNIPTTTLAEADLLISDWSSVAIEYAFGTERPVLYIDVPKKVRNPNYKDFGIVPLEEKIRTRIGAVLGLKEIKNVEASIINLLENKEKFKQEILKARREYIYNFGVSSKIGAEYIQGLCKR